MEKIVRGQGAIESNCDSTAGTLRAQGATEYLVLLAVVLVIALVSISLLGFFPGISQDARMTQSKAYWQSATPFAVLEAVAYSDECLPNASRLAMVVRNNEIQMQSITGIINDGHPARNITIPGYGTVLLSLSLAGGEQSPGNQNPCDPGGFAVTPPAQQDAIAVPVWMMGGSRMCNHDGTGQVEIKQFGVEYTAMAGEEGGIQKTFVGSSPLIIQCGGVCPSNGRC
ncbi:MAG: hypothetical protein NT051_01560 [Candidatus Micrarchaeota archaeon]|nr:hypothetical protein [Candidatus Micrarchaeota archaeon]